MSAIAMPVAVWVPMRAAAAPRQELTQIRRTYTASWNGLMLSVESAGNSWTGAVRNRSNADRLYTAERLSLSAAKTAAVEFAMFQGGSIPSDGSPEKLAASLQWKEHWTSLNL